MFSLLPLAFHIPNQAAKLIQDIIVPIQGFPCLYVVGKHPGMLRLKRKVFSIVLPAVVGAFCTVQGGPGQRMRRYAFLMHASRSRPTDLASNSACWLSRCPTYADLSSVHTLVVESCRDGHLL